MLGTIRPEKIAPARRASGSTARRRLKRAAAIPASTTSLQNVLVTMATCLLIALLLNARAVVHDSMALPDGMARTVLLAVGQGALTVAQATHLTWPRDRLDALFGHAPQPAVSPLLAVAPGSTGAVRSRRPARPRRDTMVAAPVPRTPIHRRQPAAAHHAPRAPLRRAEGTEATTPRIRAERPALVPPLHEDGAVRERQHTSEAAQEHPSQRPARPSTRPAALHVQRRGRPGHVAGAARLPAPRRTPPAIPRATPGTASSAPSQTTLPGIRPISRAHPLRLLVTGDSLPGYLGPELVNELAQLGPVQGMVDVHDGTGLTRPDYVDWSLLARQQVAADNPDAVVVWIGGNDFQNMTLPGGQFFQAGTPAWTREYERRAEICMRIWAQGARRRVYWLAMPPSREADWANDDAQINIALRHAAARVPGVEYLDILGPITNHGHYADYVYQHGQPLLVREPDGVHVNIAGSTIVAQEVRAVITREWRLGKTA